MKSKSTAESLFYVSLILLVAGVILTILPVNFSWLQTSVWYTSLNILSYAISFYVLYLSQRFRYFTIYPSSLIYIRKNQKYRIYPLLPETESRWFAKLEQIEIITSRSIKIKNLKVLTSHLILDGSAYKQEGVKSDISKEMDKTIYTFRFENPKKIDVNMSITLEIEHDENVEENRPFLEYTIKYKVPIIPLPIPLLSFKDSRRIF